MTAKTATQINPRTHWGFIFSLLINYLAKRSFALKVLSTLRDMAELRGSYEALTYRGFYQGTAYPESYVHITLTDEEDIPDAVRKLQVIYPYLMKLTYDNRRTQAAGLGEDWEADEQQSPLELLEAFYAAQNGAAMDDAQRAYAQALLETLEEAERCGH